VSSVGYWYRPRSTSGRTVSVWRQSNGAGNVAAVIAVDRYSTVFPIAEAVADSEDLQAKIGEEITGDTLVALSAAHGCEFSIEDVQGALS